MQNVDYMAVFMGVATQIYGKILFLFFIQKYMTGLDQRFALYCGSLVYILAQLLSVFRVHKYGYVLPLVVYE